MGTPLKIKIRKFMAELQCPHMEFTRERKQCGFQSFVVYECKECGKVWAE